MSRLLEFRPVKFVQGVRGDARNPRKTVCGGEVGRWGSSPGCWFLSADDLDLECLLKVAVQMTFLL